jgi:hypothetical protein
VSGNVADWERAKQNYPSTTKLTESDWVAFFDEQPDVMHAILGDIFVITKAHEATVKKSGRRPKFTNGSLDELWDMITPTYSTEPFGSAVEALIGQQSIRAFSAKIPMHYWSLIRLMRGERKIVQPNDIEGSMRTLEMIAKAGKVSAFYFAEYRTLYIFQMFEEVFTAKPNFTVGLVKRLSDIQRTG